MADSSKQHSSLVVLLGPGSPQIRSTENDENGHLLGSPSKPAPISLGGVVYAAEGQEVQGDSPGGVQEEDQGED